jgi:hypothetical protein
VGDVRDEELQDGVQAYRLLDDGLEVWMLVQLTYSTKLSLVTKRE